MRNPIFKAQVEELFRKHAFGHDLGEVERQLAQQPGSEAALADLRRGRFLASEANPAVKMVPEASRLAYGAGKAVLEPASKLGPPFIRGLGEVGNYVRGSPHLLRLGVGAALLAPILASAAQSQQKKYEDTIMGIQRDPSRVITASLDDFLEKKAASAARGLATDIGTGIRDSFAQGVGGGVGHGLVDALFGGIGKSMDTLKDIFVTDAARRRLLESLMRSDPVISDALQHNPKGKDIVLEAYATMRKFAPKLSTDMNAVRSFLREAVMGGAGVNYATIKNLVDTEKTITGQKKPTGY